MHIYLLVMTSIQPGLRLREAAALPDCRSATFRCLVDEKLYPGAAFWMLALELDVACCAMCRNDAKY
jgi:hypothetical protein